MTLRPSGDAPTAAAELDSLRAALAAEYEILEELGRGAMATVYRARDLQLAREVALKVLPRTLLHDAQLVERFQREARTAARLEHPHIVPIYRVGREGDVIYFAMQYLRGESLAAVLDRRGHLPPDEIRRLLVEVGEAIDCAACHGVVHRDIKPDNIVFDERGRSVVTDFGIARSVAEGQLTRAGVSVGTPHYMSPEQTRGEPIDARSDLYSLGVVAYRCLSARVPFDAADDMAILYAHATQPIPTPELPTAAHAAVFGIIGRLLEKDPARRIQSGAELVRLAKATDGPKLTGPVTAVLPSLPHARSRPWRRFAVAGGTAVSLALLAVLGAREIRERRSVCPSATSVEEFLVLLDPPGQVAAGERLDLRYDVCGLDRGSTYTVQVRVARRDGLLGRVLRKRPALGVTFRERADGPATRRHRTIGLDAARQGEYTLEMTVTDNQGRRRTRSGQLQVVDS